MHLLFEPVLYAHIILIVVYSVIGYSLWTIRRVNKEVTKELLIQKDINENVRLGLHEHTRDILERIRANEKLVAEARRKIAARNSVPPIGPDERIPFDEDAPLMASVLTALVVKYGDMALSLDDMRRVTENDYISVYVNTETQELVLSNNHELGDETAAPDRADLFGVNKGDDKTFH